LPKNITSRVTTGKGDTGVTRTLGGKALPKSHAVLEATGKLDAARAHLAAVRLDLQQSDLADAEALSDFMVWLLHVCFLIGTEVNDPDCVHPEYRVMDLDETFLTRLEREQERLEARLQLPRAFIACATNALAARIDIAATVVRDFERSTVRLSEEILEFDAGVILAFTNRLSDFLYVLARHVEGGDHQPVDYTALGSK